MNNGNRRGASWVLHFAELISVPLYVYRQTVVGCFGFEMVKSGKVTLISWPTGYKRVAHTVFTLTSKVFAVRRLQSSAMVPLAILQGLSPSLTLCNVMSSSAKSCDVWTREVLPKWMIRALSSLCLSCSHTSPVWA
jgi:hypothetical protein